MPEVERAQRERVGHHHEHDRRGSEEPAVAAVGSKRDTERERGEHPEAGERAEPVLERRAADGVSGGGEGRAQDQ